MRLLLQKGGFLFFALTLVIATVACGGKGGAKPGGDGTGSFPVNVARYRAPLPQVWAALNDVLRYDLLINVAVVNTRNGIFSTETVRDFAGDQRSRYRISGTLKNDGIGVVVSVYRQQEVFDPQRKIWRVIETDFTQERQILEKIGQRLQNR